jgi:tryptophanyl-tRNA synthetase
MAAAAVRGRVFSGIQSTGIPHVGNYLGALAQWCKLQDQRTALPPSETIFSVVGAWFSDPTQCRCSGQLMLLHSVPPDLHSITVPQKAEVLRQNTRDTLVALLACGLSPDRCVIFQQSAVCQTVPAEPLFVCSAPRHPCRSHNTLNWRGSSGVLRRWASCHA